MDKYIIIDAKQDLVDEEIDYILKEFSKKYRKRLYKNGEFRESINNDGYYIFVSSNSYDNSLDYCLQELIENDIDAYITTKEEFINEINDNDSETEKTFHLIMFDNQDLDDIKIDKILKKFFKQIRYYKFFEFRKNFNLYNFFCVLSDEDAFFVNDLEESLSKKGIKSMVLSDEEYNKMLEEKCDILWIKIDSDENKKISKSKLKDLINVLETISYDWVDVTLDKITSQIEENGVAYIYFVIRKDDPHQYLDLIKKSLNQNHIKSSILNREQFKNSFEKKLIISDEIDKILEKDKRKEREVNEYFEEIFEDIIINDRDLISKSFIFDETENGMIFYYNDESNRINYDLVKDIIVLLKKYNLPYTITTGEVKSIINKKTNSNKNTVVSKDNINYFNELFDNNIIGQKNAKEKITKQLISSMFNLNKNEKPEAVLFFAGPTGVGKTETCKLLSKSIYGEEKINRLDMSEYKNETSINKLIGSDNGFVGYDEGGTLVNLMKKNPNSVILFDEIEKCHPLVFDIFLQMLDEGYVTSNKGEKISFKNNIIVFTSNIGSSSVDHNLSIEENEEIVKNEINDYFTNYLNRPEILGRIGWNNIIVFNSINNKQDIYKIINLELEKYSKLLMNEYSIHLLYEKDDVCKWIYEKTDISKGVRGIKNSFDDFISNLINYLYENNLDYFSLNGRTIKIEINNVHSFKVQLI